MKEKKIYERKKEKKLWDKFWKKYFNLFKLPTIYLSICSIFSLETNMIKWDIWITCLVYKKVGKKPIYTWNLTSLMDEKTEFGHIVFKYYLSSYTFNYNLYVLYVLCDGLTKMFLDEWIYSINFITDVKIMTVFIVSWI
jgi:hypothetical protein